MQSMVAVPDPVQMPVDLEARLAMAESRAAEAQARAERAEQLFIASSAGSRTQAQQQLQAVLDVKLLATRKEFDGTDQRWP